MMILPYTLQGLFSGLFVTWQHFILDRSYLRIYYFSGLFSLVLFIAVVASFAYRRLKQERSKQGGVGGSRGGGVGSQNRADVDLLVAINSSTPRVTRWVERGLIFNLVLNNIVLYRRAPPPPYSEVPTQPSAPDYNQQV